jgi:hypothetical protein
VPLAGRLLAAARLLPAGDRARWAEEFRSELTEIARAGAGRRGQLAYAGRVVLSARRLRADLRAPRRRGPVMSAVAAALRRAGKVGAGAVPAALLAATGLAALAALVLLALAVLAVTCWVIASGDRTARASQLLLAWRGNADSPARDATPASRAGRRWPWRS